MEPSRPAVRRETGGPEEDQPAADLSDRPDTDAADRIWDPSDDRETQPGAEGLDGPDDGDGRGRKEKHHGPLGFLRELPGLILVAFLLALLIKSLFVQAFYIPSASMENTLKIGDRVLVNKLIYNIRDPRRQEIIVFENPGAVDEKRNPLSAFWHWVTEGLGVSSDPEKDFIKRVIGLPGETLEMRRGKIFIDGVQIKEPYLNPAKDLSDYGPVKVKAKHLFVMGDNRTNSQDSRSALGQIPYEKVVGKAFVILWPPSRLEWLGKND